MSTQLLHDVVLRLVDFITRRRSGGYLLMKTGAVVLVSTLGFDVAFQIGFQAPSQGWSIQFGVGNGLPKWVCLTAYVLGSLAFSCGALLVGLDAAAQFQRERRSKLIVIELRGLHSGPDTPAFNQILPAFRGHRVEMAVDFRPRRSGELVDPYLMLEQMRSLKGAVQSTAARADGRDVDVALGGLAAVPALFLLGVLFEDESARVIYDWDRTRRIWKRPEGSDDGDRFLPPEGLDALGGAKRAVLVVAASYSVAPEDIAATFDPTSPVVSLRMKDPRADRFWSEEKQQACEVAFRDTLQGISQAGIGEVDLVLAAPASLSIRFGTAYDERLISAVNVYQFEKSSSPPYPWGIRMPSHGRPDPQVVITGPKSLLL